MQAIIFRMAWISPAGSASGVEIRAWAGRGGVFQGWRHYPLPSPGFGRPGRFYAADLRRKRKKPDHGRPGFPLASDLAAKN